MVSLPMFSWSKNPMIIGLCFLWYSVKSLEYDDRLKVLRIWSLAERKNRADLLEVFKMKSGFSVVTFGTLFEVDNQQRTRGHTWKIIKYRSNLDVRKFFFSERVVDRWNKLEQTEIYWLWKHQRLQEQIRRYPEDEVRLLGGLYPTKWSHTFSCLAYFSILRGFSYWIIKCKTNFAPFNFYSHFYWTFQWRLMLIMRK